MLNAYRQKEATLKAVEHRLSKLKDLGATDEELALLHEGLQIVDASAGRASCGACQRRARAEESQAIALLYGKGYEQELERARDRMRSFPPTAR